jgi:hypothetical protein
MRMNKAEEDGKNTEKYRREQDDKRGKGKRVRGK